MNVDPGPKVYLQNRLNKCRAKMNELQPVLDAKSELTVFSQSTFS